MLGFTESELVAKLKVLSGSHRRLKRELEIYTDWANQYLERGRFKRHIQDLQSDVSDGVLLADIIEAVTGFKVLEVTRKPKTSAQMVENLNVCLTFLENIGVNLEGVTAKEIRNGNLKLILGLFFNLSRYKQAQKLSVVSIKQNTKAALTTVAPSTTIDILSKLPTTYQGYNGRNAANPSTKYSSNTIPMTTTEIVTQKSGQMECTTQNGTQSGTSIGKGRIIPKAPSDGNSVLNSPHVSFIPQPQSSTVTRNRNSADRNRSRPSSVSSIPHLPVKIRSCATLRNTSPDTHPVGHKYTSSNNNSMLDKFSFFNYKVTSGEKAKGGGFSKQTSSSSGFSSARSERSDTSNSEPSSGSTPEGPEASICLASTGVDNNVKSFSKKTFGRNFSRSKSNDTKPTNCKTVNKRPASLNSTPSNVTNSTANEENLEQKGTSNQSVNIKKSEKKESGNQKLGPKLNIQVSKTLLKETTTHKHKSVPNRKLSTTQKVKLKSTETSLTTERSKNAEHINENDQSTQSTNSIYENKNRKNFSPCMFEDPSCHSFLQKANSKYFGETDGFESSNATTGSLNLCAKIIVTADGKSRETKYLGENHLGENEQNSVRQLRLNTLNPKSENIVKAINPEIPSVPETTYPNSSEPMFNQMVNSNIPKPTAAVKGMFKHSKDTQDFESSNDMTSGDEEWKQNIKSRNTFNLLGSLNIPINSSNCENQRYLETTNHRQDLVATCQKSDVKSNFKLGPNESERQVDRPQGDASVAKVLPFVNRDIRESSKTSLRKLNTVSCHTESKIRRNDLEPPNNAKSKENDNQSCQMYRSSSAAQQIETLEGIPDAEDFNQVKKMPPVMKKCGLYGSCATGLFSRDMVATEESDDVMLSIKPMPPLARASPYGYIRNRLSSSRNTTNSLYMANFRLHADVKNTDDGVGRPSQHMVTIDDSSKIYGVPVKRALGSSRALLDVNYFSDMDSVNSVAGYMSDGEVIRQSPVYRAEDFCSGYTSEGGVFLYSRRLTRKVSEKKLPPEKVNVLQDHSQLSDNIIDISSDDNLTELSISTEATSNGSHTRTPRATENHLAAGNENKRQYDEQALWAPSAGKLTASRSSNVKKADSSMQTESKVIHRMSSSVWKKYPHHYGNNGSESEQMKDKNTISSSETEKKNGVAYGTFDNLNGGYKAEHKRQIQVPGDQKCRDGDVAVEKGLGNERSFNPKSTKLNCNLINQLSKPSLESQETGGSRTLIVMGSETNNEETLTCTDFVCDKNKICKSKSKSSSRKDMSLDTISTDDCDLNVSDINCSQSSNLFMNMTTSSFCGDRDSYKRKESAKVVANTQTNMDENCVSNSDSKYSSSSREISKQNPLTSTGIKGFQKYSYRTHSVFSGSSDSKSNYVILSDFPPVSKDRSVNGSRLSVPIKPNVTDMANCAITDPFLYKNNYVPSSNSYACLRYSGSSGASLISESGARSCSGSGLTDDDSMESLSSVLSNVHAQVHNVRANSLTHARLLLHQRDLSESPHLTRSSSIRSTKSEKLYPSMLRRSSEVNNDVSVCASVGRHSIRDNTNDRPPLPPTNLNTQGVSRNLFPISPVNSMSQTSTTSVKSCRVPISVSVPQYMGGMVSRQGNKTDEIHGSSLSVVSSMLFTTEDKQSQEIKKLKRELEQANEKVATLTSQLATNAHMVAAFEQSLSNMTNRLHNLTVSAEQKDSELGELRSTVDALSNQSTEAGFTKMALQSMPAVQRSINGTSLVRRHTFNNTKEHAIQEHKISRQKSTDSMSSANSISSRNSGFGDQCDGKNKKKKKGWLRSSFSKAFSRSKKNKNGSVSDVEDMKQFLSDSSTLHSPLVRSQHKNSEIKSEQTIKSSHSSSVLFEKEYDRSTELINTLKKQLREKEMVITDIRLETLTSAQQLEALKETVKKMQDEMVILKQENSWLHKLVSTKRSASSQSSLPQENSVENLVKRLSTSSHSESPNLDAYLSHTTNFQDGKYATISVFLGCHGDNTSFKAHNENVSEVLIGAFLVNSKMSWDLMDNIVNQTFKEYVQRIDLLSSLGLNTESILSYQVGEIVREKESEKPELLPCGYLVGNNMQVQVALKGANQNSVDGLSFETLIAKSIIQRYVSLLLEHRRIILCGPSGTGKTYLAQKLAEHLVLRNLKEISPGAIAIFEVDHKSAEELQQYLFTVAEQCERSNPSDLPTVIILNNLHYVGTLSEVFNGFLSARYQKCPYIIGTMNQATCSTTNLQLHHNFRWVLCANHMEPVKGFLGRYLRRKLVEHEIQSNSNNPELTKIIEWMPKVWEHLNNFLETHSSSDVTIGPKLFLSCPLDVVSSQVWFTDLWNYDIVPYIVEVVREGLQLYGLRAPWNDPADWVFKNHPWPTSGEIKWSQLLHLRPEDIGYEKWPASGAPTEGQQGSSSDVEADPLLNMLLRLQETASCSSPHDNHGDTGMSTANLINEDALQSPL
ncbi:uncharacterized protein LOC143245425 [Tachypleus tridentatus]|uniref:uncharacterized protein LOC143245425 n=1 Tax=Tachypleus tridentatus TaxID=6853 RepID=UPI003FD6BCA9